MIYQKIENKMKKNLSRSPQNINENTWYYEENYGIHIIHYRGLSDFVEIIIPWKKLRVTMNRLNKNRTKSVPRRRRRVRVSSCLGTGYNATAKENSKC